LSAQFSAAVADTGGSGGLIEELTRNRVTARQAYVLLVGVGLVLTWTLDVFEIISYASRAFAIYYALQAGVAAAAALRTPGRAHLVPVFAGLALLGAMIVIFGASVKA
jgi:hypothetical protein